MAKLARRGFLKRTTASVATIGVMASVPTALTAITAEAPQITETAGTDLSSLSLAEGPVIAHISNLATGEISLLSGTQEFVFRDPDLVMRLLRFMR
jgi:hypothetical protein